MINWTFFMFLAFLMFSGCAGKGKGRSVQDILKLEQGQVRKIPVASRDEARKIMGNHLNFLKLLFEQSHDPYYGKPRWSVECLQINQVGEIIESSTSLQSLSTLLLGPNGHAGHCSENDAVKKSHLIYVWCESSPELIELKIPTGAVEDLSLPFPCHDKRHL
jgi:hypothetical protein